MKKKFHGTGFMHRSVSLAIGISSLAVSSTALGQNKWDTSFRIFDGSMDLAAGADVELQWGTNAPIHYRANENGYVRGWHIPEGETVLVTLGQRISPNGLLLGQVSTYSLPMQSPAGSDEYVNVETRSQPIASPVFIANNFKDTQVPYGNGMSVRMVELIVTPGSGGDQVPEAVFNFTPYIGLLPNATTIEQTEDFFDVTLPTQNYKLGAHIVVEADTYLGDVGFSMAINCDGYGFTAQPHVSAAAITDDSIQPSHLMQVNATTWQDGYLHMWVRGMLQKGHQIILLSTDGPNNAVNWYSGAPALQLAALATENGSKVAASAKRACSPETSSIAVSPTSGSVNSASLDTPPCENGDSSVPPPANPSCTSWVVPVPTPEGSNNCGSFTPSGLSSCKCHWDEGSGKTAGSGGTVTITTRTGWKIDASVKSPIKGVDVSVGGGYSSDDTTTYSQPLSPGANNHGQVAQTFSGGCVRGQKFCRNFATWKTKRIGYDIYDYISDPCGTQRCTTSKLVTSIDVYMRICDKVLP